MTNASTQVYHQSVTRTAVSIPDETALLCEGCGYTLSGLAADSACPECGKPIPESSPEIRQTSAWERRYQWFATTAAVLFHPTRFFRTLATRADVAPALRFALSHWIIASAMLLVTANVHSNIVGIRWQIPPWAVLAMPLLMWVLTLFAARLTHWEASYRGLRMPLSVVQRAMYFHAAHYVPVAAAALLTVLIYRWMFLRQWVAPTSIVAYLYVLCAEVLLGAGYLFKTYWIGMRNIMYANR